MDRRKASRRIPLTGEPISRVRLRTGHEMTVVDVAHGGVLVEGQVRLLPGTHIEAHVVTRSGRLLIRSRVVRCSVAALQPDGILYRGALAFDRHVDTAPNGYSFPGAAHGVGDPSGHDYPHEVPGSAPPEPEALVV
jgi:hypothetical protein